MSDLDRRDFLKLAAGAAVVVGVGAVSYPLFKRLSSGERAPIDVAKLFQGKIDYTKAKATPTICFGCTTHCGVIGWVQDGRVRKI
ncbi:MAG: ubiquinol-cytochrome c reductase iron-sulfur subunit N-terminal domain-containing protein, partial [Planctomycetota bacterium JB042]